MKVLLAIKKISYSTDSWTRVCVCVSSNPDEGKKGKKENRENREENDKKGKEKMDESSEESSTAGSNNERAYFLWTGLQL